METGDALNELKVKQSLPLFPILDALLCGEDRGLEES